MMCLLDKVIKLVQNFPWLNLILLELRINVLKKMNVDDAIPRQRLKREINQGFISVTL